MEEYFHMLMIQPGMKPKLPLGFLSAFCPNGGVGKMRLYGLLRGQVHICVQSMWQTIGGSGDMLLWEILNLDILLDAIWRTLGLFLHKYNLPFIVSFYKGLNWFTCKIEFSAYPRGASQSQGGQMLPPERNPDHGLLKVHSLAWEWDLIISMWSTLRRKPPVTVKVQEPTFENLFFALKG